MQITIQVLSPRKSLGCVNVARGIQSKNPIALKNRGVSVSLSHSSLPAVLLHCRRRTRSSRSCRASKQSWVTQTGGCNTDSYVGQATVHREPLMMG